jgi:TusA-related sulfurtransferase
MMQRLDLRDLLCPMPVIRTQKAAKVLKTGDELELLCTDPGTLHDIPVWCKMYGHEIVVKEKKGNEYYFLIRIAHEENPNENPKSGTAI